MENPCPGGLFPFSDAGTPFAVILDETCGRLENSRNRGALKRIQKMEEILRGIEDELDAILRGPDEAAVPLGAEAERGPGLL
ncbi:MAG: hypothetical protein LBH35_05855 [Treponema sp.]|jgi:hypothetical protein|nr:hypothetical protein [Treponema sp.]